MQKDTNKNLNGIVKIAMGMTWAIFIVGLLIRNRDVYLGMALGALISTFHFWLIISTLKELSDIANRLSFYLSYSFRVAFIILMCLAIFKFITINLIYFLIGFFTIKVIPLVIFVIFNKEE